MTIFDHRQTAGLDISDHKVRIVTIRQLYRKLVLNRFAEVDLPKGCIHNGTILNPTILVQTLRDLPKRGVGGPWQNRYVHVGLPEQQTFITTVPTPSLTKDVAEREAHRFLPFKEEEIYYDIQINRSMHTVSVAASRKEIVNHYLQILRTAGYSIAGLHCETEAIAKAAVTDPEDTKRGVMIVDLGTARTTIVFAMQECVYFTTSYPSVLEGNSIHQQHLVAVLQQVMQYYQEHYIMVAPLAKMILCGSGAAVPNLVEWLHYTSEVNVEVAHPTKLFKSNYVLKRFQHPLAFTTAIGLALPK